MQTKKCCTCKIEKPYSEFHIQRARKDGRQNICKPCKAIYKKEYRIKNIEKIKKQNKKYRAANKEKIRLYEFKYKYGLTPEEYYDLLNSQNNKCKICGATEGENGKRLSVDHNHKTGKVRSFLCNDCNSGLGFFKDNSDLLDKASEYLKKW